MPGVAIYIVDQMMENFLEKISIKIIDRIQTVASQMTPLGKMSGAGLQFFQARCTI
jgi:hypothetical protein